ncbi:MAG: hypothetical protein AAGM22_28200 [Acidobacteriota bacterium]
MALEVQSECTGCGARLRYSPEHSALECDRCGIRRAIEDPAGGEVGVFDFEKALADPERLRPAREIFPDGQETRCERCGARTVLAGQSGSCPYCGAPVLLEAESDDLLSPDSMSPFAIDRAQAKSAAASWARGLWFAPRSFHRKIREGDLEGVYLPYWCFNWHSRTYYGGQSGDKSPWDGEIRWTPTGGSVDFNFEDILIIATSSVPASLVSKCGPWSYHRLRPFDASYLLGFSAERYDRHLEKAFRSVRLAQTERIRLAVRADIFGERAKIEWMDIVNDSIEFRLCLLPFWIGSFSVRGRVHRVLVHGETGRVAGERPLSSRKLGAVALGLAAAAVLFFWMVLS